MKIVSLKAAIKKVFPTAENIVEQSGYNMRTVWFDMDGKVWYLHSDGVGYAQKDRVYYREVDHRKDYSGKVNQWDFISKLESLGFKLYITPKNCDYNRG